MPERGRVVDHDDVARERTGARFAGEYSSAERAPDRQHGLLPGVAGAVGERRRRADHPVAIGPQRRQPHRHLAGQPLDAADLGADRGAGVDRDGGVAPARGRGVTAPSAAHYAWLPARRR